MQSLVSCYLEECAKEIIESKLSSIFESKIDGDEIDGEDVDGDGELETFYIDMSKIIDDELEKLSDDDEESTNESAKARAPKLRGKALKNRKNKALIMKSIMGEEDVKGAIDRLKKVLMRKAKSLSSKMGVSNRQVQKAFKGKVRI